MVVGNVRVVLSFVLLSSLVQWPPAVMYGYCPGQSMAPSVGVGLLSLVQWAAMGVHCPGLIVGVGLGKVGTNIL